VVDGLDVLGYCYRSLLDSDEWGSYRPAFGLNAADRQGDFTRTPKPSLAWLGSIATENAASID